jgi:hypothetical protein
MDLLWENDETIDCGKNDVKMIKKKMCEIMMTAER